MKQDNRRKTEASARPTEPLSPPKPGKPAHQPRPALRGTALALVFAALFSLWQVFFLCPLPIYGEEGDETPVSASHPPTVTHAKSALVYNFENDTVLFEYNPVERLYPTSTVKLMTALVAWERLGNDLSKQVTVTREMLNEVAGNNVALMEGETVTVEQMLSVLLVNSANDAAIVLAYAAYGGLEAFVARMNEKAAELGAYDTYYTNPTGMHNDAMVTTARDTALIAQAVYANPTLVEMASTPKYVMEATNLCDYRNIYNRNSLISKYYNTDYYYERALGLNAGSTNQGGYCIAAVAEDPLEGLTYLAVVMGADDDEEGTVYSYQNAITLLDWAFGAYGYAQVLSTSQFVSELPVALSSTLDYVTLAPAESLSVYLPTEVNVATDVRYSYNTYEESLSAPVKKGDEVGTITALYGDEILGSCALVTTSDIARSEFLYFLSRVRTFTESRFFRATVVFLVIFSLLYVFLKAGYRERRLRARSSRRRGR